MPPVASLRSSSASGGGVYFERQDAALCGQHLLNNLLSGRYFAANDLAALAAELDAMETDVGVDVAAAGTTTGGARAKAWMSGTANVDAAGNFSVQVLELAMQRAAGLSLKRDKKALEEALRSVEAGNAGVALCFNYHDHWFCAKSAPDGTMYVLDSLKPAPIEIKRGFLTAFAAQLQTEGWSVFVVDGKLPAPLVTDESDPDFFSRERIAAAVEGGGAGDKERDAKREKPAAFTGTGYTLRGGVVAASAALAGGAGPLSAADDDPELRAALAASLAEFEDVQSQQAEAAAEASQSEADESLPPVEVGVALVMPSTGRRIRKKFPPGATGVDVFALAHEQAELKDKSRFRIVDPATKTLVVRSTNLARFAPSVTLVVEL